MNTGIRLACGGLLGVAVTVVSVGAPPEQPPNILFIIMDDVGIDQLSIFNSQADPAPSSPTIDTIAAAGVRFTNYWAMPECSPARASFFTGRYPFRNGVTNIILDNDLPGGQVSPFEVTTPRLLDAAGYTSSLIGKFHLGNENPAGNRSPAALGWDFFDGILAGVPPNIDATVGMQGGELSCGFPTGSEPTGVCWFDTPSGTPICDDMGGAGYTGLDCLTLGGIPALNAGGQFAQSCDDTVGPPDFEMTNGYYVWPKTRNHHNGVQNSTSREYMTIDHTDQAIDWIQKRTTPAGSPRPWMCSVSYNSDHTPYQQPPVELTPASLDVLDCTDSTALTLSNLMIEAMDTEIARLLVSTGLAVPDGDGLDLRLDETNTVIIVVGDNGTFFPVVQRPYNALRAKGTCYQTGVTCPLIVAGPSGIVNGANREVDHMVNCVDLFELAGELAGLDVDAVVPASHVLDSESMLPYLQTPGRPAIRTCNFAQIGIGLPAPSSFDDIGPCVLSIDVGKATASTCDDILFTSQGLCVANGGCWYGTPDPTLPIQQCNMSQADFPTCCALLASGQVPPGTAVVPRSVSTIFNNEYKLLKFERACCDRGTVCDDGPPGVFTKTYELYRIDKAHPLDNAENNLLGIDGGCPSSLTGDDAEAFTELSQALEDLLATEIVCHGDGNLDKRVDVKDLVGVMQNMGVPSVFDVNSDGTTDDLDAECVMVNFGLVCTPDDPGVNCAGTVGACCVGGSDCPITTQPVCETMLGGTYQGDRTTQCCDDPCGCDG